MPDNENSYGILTREEALADPFLSFALENPLAAIQSWPTGADGSLNRARCLAHASELSFDWKNAHVDFGRTGEYVTPGYYVDTDGITMRVMGPSHTMVVVLGRGYRTSGELYWEIYEGITPECAPATECTCGDGGDDEDDYSDCPSCEQGESYCMTHRTTHRHVPVPRGILTRITTVPVAWAPAAA